MCLYSETKIPKIATKPIHVYKVIKAYDNFWEAVYQHSRFCYGSLINLQSAEVVYNSCIKVYEITKGFFHSVAYREYAAETENYVRRRSPCTTVHCIIPIGALYCEEGNGEYASNKLIVGRPIKGLTKERLKKLKYIKGKKKILDFIRKNF